MSETYSAGIATAYGSAKRAGYSGSYADFCAAMAAITAPSATASGLPAGSDPTAAYNEGVFAFGIPKGDKGDTGATGPQGPKGDTGATGNGIASIAKTATVGKTDTYTITYTDGTTTTFDVTNGEVTEAQMEAELTKKANTDGYYQDMTVGNAEQLVSTIGKADETPYLFRTTGGSVDVGDRMKLKKVVGVSVPWNQIQKNTVSRTSNGITCTFSDGKLSVTGTATDASYWLPNNVDLYIDFYANHVYLFDVGNGAYDVSSVSPLPYSWYVSGASGVNIQKPTLLYKPTENLQGDMQFRVYVGTTIDMAFMPQIFDLTLALGSTIADYVYTLESATPGSGIAKLKSWGFFRKPYYAYNAGSMLSVNASAHEEIGFNQFSGEGAEDDKAFKWLDGSVVSETNSKISGYIPVVPGMTYYTNYSAQIILFDANKNYIGNPGNSGFKLFTPTAETAYVRLGWRTSYNNNTDMTAVDDINVNLHWDGERDGEYAPYVKHSYPLDSSLTLRGIPKLDANNNLYYKGDEYTPDGNVDRLFGEADLGSLEWTYSDTGLFFVANVTGRKTGSAPTLVDMTTSKYGAAVIWTASAATLASATDKTAYYQRTNATIIIKDSAYTDPDLFKTAVTGVKLVYELATPTTETADPYQETQVCDDFGTEAFVVTEQSGVEIPVGSVSVYNPNLRAKLEMAPDSPSGDGDYIVRQTDGQNEYVEYISPVPAAPSEDGTYTLKVTVSGSTVTKAWVAD